MKSNCKKIKTKNVLLSPLNWGKGHAARLLPIAFQLYAQGYHVVICAYGEALELMQKEFPNGDYVEDIPFSVKYATTRPRNMLTLLGQLPAMFLQVYREHQLLQKLEQKYAFEYIISDNRYGMYHANVKSIFIGHQLSIKVPFGGFFLNAINRLLINQFDACWVPDYAAIEHSLAGELSQYSKIKKKVFIGPLSRALPLTQNIKDNAPVLYLLSGVEPQRSIFEELIVQKMRTQKHAAILVRGTNKPRQEVEDGLFLRVYDYCTIKQLQELVTQCQYIVARSGYSTIMDLVIWRKEAVLIPTPGQFEQEYLASYLLHKKWFYSLTQETFMQLNPTKPILYKCPELPIVKQNYDELLRGVKNNRNTYQNPTV